MSSLLLFLFILFGLAGCIVMIYLFLVALLPHIPDNSGTNDSGTNAADEYVRKYKSRQRAKRDAEYIAAAQKNGGHIRPEDEIVIDSLYRDVDD